MKTSKFAPFAVALSLSIPCVGAFAQEAMVKGEVKKIDGAAGKITLKHGPIKSLDMDEDGMTMVFRVPDTSMLKQVKVGDKVQFEAERATAGITITKLRETARSGDLAKDIIFRPRRGGCSAPRTWVTCRRLPAGP